MYSFEGRGRARAALPRTPYMLARHFGFDLRRGRSWAIQGGLFPDANPLPLERISDGKVPNAPARVKDLALDQTLRNAN